MMLRNAPTFSHQCGEIWGMSTHQRARFPISYQLEVILTTELLSGQSAILPGRDS